MSQIFSRMSTNDLLEPYQSAYKQNYDFYELWKFRSISWKIDILSKTAYLRFESKNPFAHMWHI